MTKTFVRAAAAAFLVAASGCHKKESSAVQTQAQEPQKVEFVPPSDSSVSVDQVKRWMACNMYLDSLSLLFKDSLSTSDAAKQMAYQDHFLKAQDRICVKVGMPGGYAEYLWILRCLGNPVNKRIVDSLKLTTYR